MTKQIKKTVKHSAIYAFGTMLRRLTGLVMLPIYTRYLTPSDYGVVELLGMAIEITGILIGLRISQAMFRYYILAETEKEKHETVSTVLFTVAVTSTIGAVIIFLSAESLTRIIFGNTEYIFEFQLFALTLVTNAITAVGLSYLRAKQLPLLFISINIFSLLIQVCLNIYLVVMLEMHVTGVVYSAVISGALISAGLMFYILVNVGFNYSGTITIKLIKFVAPLVLASIGAFYVSYADKYFLRLYGSLNEVGLYALAARVSSILATVFEAFNMSWGADRFEVVKKENARQIYNQVFRLLNIVLLIIGAGLALFSNDFFRIMTSPDFYPAGYIVPILLLSVIFRIYTIFCNFGALYRDKTKIMAEASWIRVLIATIGYVTLIPYIGIYGAAIAIALSAFIEFIWVYTQSRKLYDMNLQWQPVVTIFIVCMVCVIFGLLLPEGDLYYFGLRVLLFTGLITSVYLLPIMNDDEKELVRKSLGKLTAVYRK